jgi:hypothetical protein
MRYLLTGRLTGQLTPQDVEPLSDVTVRVYLNPSLEDGTQAPGDLRPGFGFVSTEEERAKESYLVAQGRTGPDGAFEIDFSTRTVFGHRGWTSAYAGQPLEIDVFCRAVPGRATEVAQEPVHFTLGYLVPDWRESGDALTARFEHTLDPAQWSKVREQFDAWSVLGRVTTEQANTPLHNLRVFAFDADLIKDDPLGSAVTDEQGRFRIDFGSRAFQRTLSGIPYERKGPDLYFRIESPDGRLLIDEGKAGAAQPDRKDIGNASWTEIRIHG